MKKLNGALYLVRRLRERGNPVPPWWKLRGIVDRDPEDRHGSREPGFHGHSGTPAVPSTG
jgi:hypothetical protein